MNKQTDSAILKIPKSGRISGISAFINIMAKAITTAEFPSLVADAKVPVLLDFWAEWCAPCRAFSSVVERFSGEYESRVIVGKVNVDEEPKLAEQFRVMSIPTVLIFKDGKLAETLVGARSFESLSAAVNNLLE